MADNGTKYEIWVKGDSLEPRLDLWWSKLLPPQRREVLEEFAGTLPEWMSQSLLRAGVPLNINPGLAAGSTAGEFLAPKECLDFVERKRVEAATPRKRFWKRALADEQERDRSRTQPLPPQRGGPLPSVHASGSARRSSSRDPDGRVHRAGTVVRQGAADAHGHLRDAVGAGRVARASDRRVRARPGRAATGSSSSAEVSPSCRPTASRRWRTRGSRATSAA